VRGRPAAIVAISLGLGLAGCGGHAATKKDVVTRANAICFETLQDIRSVAPPKAGATSAAALATYLEKVAPIVAKEAAQTRALPRPAADITVLDDYVAAVTASANAYRALATAAAHHSSAGVSAALARLRASPAPALAARYGLAQCSAAAGTAVS
jgi:hypothetical protein